VEMTRGDKLVERAADRLEAYAREAAGETGLKSKLAAPLADDAVLLRGMRPSRIAARLRGEPAHEAGVSTPLPRREPEARGTRSPDRGPSPILFAVGAFAMGLLIAKVIDWRGHAHPR
jgi:hypothetical protein